MCVYCIWELGAMQESAYFRFFVNFSNAMLLEKVKPD